MTIKAKTKEIYDSFNRCLRRPMDVWATEITESLENEAIDNDSWYVYIGGHQLSATVAYEEGEDCYNLSIFTREDAEFFAKAWLANQVATQLYDTFYCECEREGKDMPSYESILQRWRDNHGWSKVFGKDSFTNGIDGRGAINKELYNTTFKPFIEKLYKELLAKGLIQFVEAYRELGLNYYNNY